MLFSITVWIAAEAFFGQKAWLLDSDFPLGGPQPHWKTEITAWYMEWSRIEVVIVQLMTDALMIHRCRIIWNSNRVVVAPIILWLATLTLGVMLEWANSLPGSSFQTGLSDQICFAYWSISVFLNTTLTCMICYRVVRYGRMIQKHLGNEYASLYFTVATVIIESVLPYTLSGIAFLVSFGMGSPTYGAFISVYLLMMCISPQMLILRVISGAAWDNETFTQPGSTIKFNNDSRDISASQLLNSIRTRDHVLTFSNVAVPDGRDKVRFLDV